MSIKQATQQGFSLIEMAVVLVIVGLLLGGLLMPLSSQIDMERYRETGRHLSEIREALMGFALDKKRLPCPDTSGDGIENTLPACINIEGGVPWATLGVGRFDAWHNPIRYRVDENFITTIPAQADTLSGLQITDQSGAALSAANPDAPVAIIFSCGKDGLANDENDAAGANTPNCANSGAVNTIYIQDIPNDSAANQFDDVLFWLSKNTLLNRLASAGKWP